MGHECRQCSLCRFLSQHAPISLWFFYEAFYPSPNSLIYSTAFKIPPRNEERLLVHDDLHSAMAQWKRSDSLCVASPLKRRRRFNDDNQSVNAADEHDDIDSTKSEDVDDPEDSESSSDATSALGQDMCDEIEDLSEYVHIDAFESDEEVSSPEGVKQACETSTTPGMNESHNVIACNEATMEAEDDDDESLPGLGPFRSRGEANHNASFARLTDGQMLNDECINEALSLFRPDTPCVYVADTHIISTCSANGITTTHTGIKDCHSTLVFPIHHPDVEHRSLAIVDREQGICTIYDSSSLLRPRRRAAVAVQRFIRHLKIYEERLSITTDPLPYL